MFYKNSSRIVVLLHNFGKFDGPVAVSQYIAEKPEKFRYVNVVMDNTERYVSLDLNFNCFRHVEEKKKEIEASRCKNLPNLFFEQEIKQINRP